VYAEAWAACEVEDELGTAVEAWVDAVSGFDGWDEDGDIFCVCEGAAMNDNGLSIDYEGVPVVAFAGGNVGNLVIGTPFNVGRLNIPKPGPNGPMPPPPKNCLNISSGDISSSNMDAPPPPPPGDLVKAENGEDADAPPNLLSGSPPNRSNFDFLSGSDSTWNALETTVNWS
jgi:hypothetical protein